MIRVLCFFLFTLSLWVAGVSSAETGSQSEPVRYLGGVAIDPSIHDGRLRPPIGTVNRQVLRVNRTHPDRAEGSGWTYNHAPNLAYWNQTFYLEYLSNPVDEHIPPGQTLIATSKDGISWSTPEVVFPPYEPPAGVEIPEGSIGYMMHQRMGFHVSPEGRLLVLAFYGHAEDPFQKGGIGRVVREAYQDGTYGPIYFIRYSSHADWNESNTSFPFYRASEDAGFVEACEALLANKLVTLQWFDEDRGLDGFYEEDDAGAAFSWYRRSDEKIVGLWKRSKFALSEDGGRTFSPVVKVPTLLMAGGKQWGQRTDIGNYIIAYNPIEMDEHRYPLVLIQSEDGILFDNIAVVHGEVPPRRFMGRWKDFGPCYVRGIIEGNGDPPGEDVWLTYSVNKEDIWVSKVPLPIEVEERSPVTEDFEEVSQGDLPVRWNLYSPKWAPVTVDEAPGGEGKALCLRDSEPYDYAKAVRIFPESQSVRVGFDLTVGQSDSGTIEMEVLDRFGNRPIRLHLDETGNLSIDTGAEFLEVAKVEAGDPARIEILAEANPQGSFSLRLDGREVAHQVPLAEAVKSVERISFRTGPYRDKPTRLTPNQVPSPPLVGADEPVREARFWIDNVSLVPQ
jgi:hypothetical protein